jgi:DNA (cytosine-5)-methyltransferase 1
MIRPRAVDLFAGAGGMSLGFEQAGFDIIAAVDFDPVHCATHEYNFPNVATICDNIARVTGGRIRETAAFFDDVDLVFGGPPCQGFSLIGKRSLEDPRNSLVHHFVRIVLEMKPRCFVFENVPGLVTGKHRAFLREIIDALEEGDYCVASPYKVLNAAEYGVPQNRERLFVLGARKDTPTPTYPTQTHRLPGVPKGLFDGRDLCPTVTDAIDDLPEVEDYTELWDSDRACVRFGVPSEYVAQLRGLKADPRDFSYPRPHHRDVLTSSLRTRHTEISRRRFAATRHGRIEPISRFLRLDPEGLCNTLRAGTATERGAFTSPRPIHPKTPRCITVREAARLHSYPDWFRFHITKWHGFRQVGNSVPPLLARAIGNAIIGALGVTPVRPDRVLAFGDERLLRLTVSEAADYYQVRRDVLGRRTRKAVAVNA